MSEKQLLIESCDFSFSCNLSDEKKTALTESLKISAGKNDTLIVKNIPCTILNRRNQNGRIYPTTLMQKAIEEARPKMQNRELICSGSEHPDMSFCPLEKGSHVVINAYIKNVDLDIDGKKGRYDVLFNDWLVLPTDPHGKNLKTYILNNVSVGTSIRSLGSCDPDGTVTELEYLGTDCVSQPSSSTRTIMNMRESVEVSTAPLTETFIVSASATNVVHDLDSAVDLSKRIDNANFGTIKKTSTKLDSEVDPKTGAETTMVTLETETEDEVSDIDQALAMAKQAMMNGMADIDSVTIENVKEEQPKESAENSDAPVLNEDSVSDNPYIQYVMNNIDKLSDAQLKRFNELKTNFENGIIDEEDIKVFANSCGLPALDDEEQYGSCAWCGDVLPLSDLKKEKDLGYICNHCAKGLESREGPLNWEDEYVPESAMTEAVDSNVEKAEARVNFAIRHLLKLDEELALRFAGEREAYLQDPELQQDDISMVGNLDELTNKIKKAIWDIEKPKLGYAESAMKEDGNENPYVLLGKICQNSTEDSWIQKKARQMANSFEHGEIDQPTFVARLNDMILANDFKLPESAMTEAAKKEEDPKTGKHFVLKCPAGFAAMDGNTLVFIDNPKEALHFIVGKEETGLVHLSEVEKILDTMGVYDVEKYYRKDTTDISAPEEKKEEPVKEGFLMGDGGVTQNSNEISGHAIKEDNGSNTRYSAEVKINGANGESSETIPVSAVEIDSINNEIANLYDMKTQKADGQVSITVTDTTSGKQFMFNPESRMIEPLENELMQNESAGELEQNGNKLSMEIDDKNKVEKEFANPAQASIAKAGIEAGKLGGDVLMSEDDDRPQYQDAPDYSDQNIEPGWYAGAQSVGVVGPYKTKEELIADLGEENIKKVDIEYIAPEDLGLAAESAKIDEVMYNEPGEASDPYIEKPMTDAVEQDIVVTANNIDWNNQDLIDVYMNHLEADDPVSFGDIQSKINDLPNTVDIRMSKDELPEDVNIDTLKELVKNKIAKQYVMKVNDLEIADLNSVN